MPVAPGVARPRPLMFSRSHPPPSPAVYAIFLIKTITTEISRLLTGGQPKETTMITATEAYEAMLEHHKRLGEELAGRADAVSGAVAAGQPYGAAVAGLVAYLAEEVLPHAAAEEKTIYPAAARAGLASTVTEMIAEHVTLSALGARVATLTDGEAAGQAQQIARLFTAHAAKENDVLLPALLADNSADLAGLLAQMHDQTGHHAVPAPAAADQPEDTQATVLSLLLQAAAALARAGEADRACKITASAWAALHETRPDLAARVTAALRAQGQGPDERLDDEDADDEGDGGAPREQLVDHVVADAEGARFGQAAEADDGAADGGPPHPVDGQLLEGVLGPVNKPGRGHGQGAAG